MTSLFIVSVFDCEFEELISNIMEYILLMVFFVMNVPLDCVLQPSLCQGIINLTKVMSVKG